MQTYKYLVRRTKTKVDDYELVYLEKHKYVIVYKNGKPHYFIKVRINRNNRLVLECNCPWAVMSPMASTHPCQHVKNALANINFDKVKEVRSFTNKTNEEISIGDLEKHLATFNR